MKWQGEGLPQHYPPWIDYNPNVNSVVGQVLQVVKTTKKPQLISSCQGLVSSLFTW